jgi:predicted dienelactone hydrolase
MKIFHLLFGQGLLVAATLTSLSVAGASEVGWRQFTIPVSATNSAAIPVALYYPTETMARAIPMGPFTVRAAIGAPPEPKVKGLILLSHGTGGSELAHSSLAEALARSGYLVAALRHPGDNWQDRSVWQRLPSAFFTERPTHVSSVIDALLADAEWKGRIATDGHELRIGALGHSAGGYTVMALAGGQVDLSRITMHCQADRTEDPIFCGMGRAGSPPDVSLIPPATDKRVRAVVAMAPMGVAFTAQSLASVTIPVKIYSAEKDSWLVPRFHANWIATNVPDAKYAQVGDAWHFAFMDRPGMPIPTRDGDAAADPPGFDRPALLARIGQELSAFFDAAFAR